MQVWLRGRSRPKAGVVDDFLGINSKDFIGPGMSRMFSNAHHMSKSPMGVRREDNRGFFWGLFLACRGFKFRLLGCQFEGNGCFVMSSAGAGVKGIVEFAMAMRCGKGTRANCICGWLD